MKIRLAPAELPLDDFIRMMKHIEALNAANTDDTLFDAMVAAEGFVEESPLNELAFHEMVDLLSIGRIAAAERTTEEWVAMAREGFAAEGLTQYGEK